MIKTRIVQANNDISLDNQLNVELEDLQNNGNEIINIQYQQTTVFNAGSMKLSFSAMIVYKEMEVVEHV